MADEQNSEILLRLVAAAAERPEILQAIEDVLGGSERLLYNVKDVCRWTGWSEGHIRKLCQEDMLPHIPAKAPIEIKFLRSEVEKALRKMQVGGDYGKRRRPKKD